MSELNDYTAKFELENEICSVHGNHAEIEVIPEGLQVKKSCCEEFQQIVREKIIKKMQEQSRTEIQKINKDTFNL